MIFLVAVEPSGDALGADLIKALRAKAPNVPIEAIGGTRMCASLNMSSPVSIEGLAILGLVEGLQAYPKVKRRVAQTISHIMKRNPTELVLIDSWGFMIRVAKGLKAQGFQGKIIKYVAPQVWAMREGRSAILAQHVDHLLSIHAFDAPFFTRHGLPVTYVGNPMFDQDYLCGDGQKLRHELNIQNDARVMCVLFGSRSSEITRLMPPFIDAIDKVRADHANIAIISPLSDAVSEQVKDIAKEHTVLQSVHLIDESRKLDAFALADFALACSGTVTTQLACAGVPTIVAYKLNWLTYFIAKHLFKPDYISIVNIAARESLMPEFVQEACTGEALADAARAYLDDKSLRERASLALLSQTQKMRGRGGLASKRAAAAILELNGHRS